MTTQYYYIAHRGKRAYALRRHPSDKGGTSTEINEESPYEIQVLDEAGRALAVHHFRPGEQSAQAAASVIPARVMEVVLALPVGNATFVNEEGHEVQPF